MGYSGFVASLVFVKEIRPAQYCSAKGSGRTPRDVCSIIWECGALDSELSVLGVLAAMIALHGLLSAMIVCHLQRLRRSPVGRCRNQTTRYARAMLSVSLMFAVFCIAFLPYLLTSFQWVTLQLLGEKSASIPTFMLFRTYGTYNNTVRVYTVLNLFGRFCFRIYLNYS